MFLSAGQFGTKQKKIGHSCGADACLPGFCADNEHGFTLVELVVCGKPPREASIAWASRSLILNVQRSACSEATHGSLVPTPHTSALEMCATSSFLAAKPSARMAIPSTCM